MNVIQEIHDRMEYLSEQSILNRCMTPSDSESSPLSSPCCTPPRQFGKFYKLSIRSLFIVNIF